MKHILLLLCLSLCLVPGARADSLWKAGQKSNNNESLYVDQKAHRIGDIITVLIVESSSVSQNTSSSTSRESNIEGEVKDWFNLNLAHGLHTSDNSGTLPKWEIDASNEFSGGGSYKGNYNVQSQLTTRVTDVLPNGNLVIEGESQVKNNEELNTVAISGIVRPQDVGTDNTILSTLVADKKVYVKGKGPLSDKTKRGVLGSLLDWVWPF